MALFWTAGLSLLAVAMYQVLVNSNDPDAASILVASVGMLWAGLLLTPSVATSLARLLNKPLPNFRLFRAPGRKTISFSLAALVLVIPAGKYLAENNLALLLPPLHLLGATLSVVLVLWLAVRNLDLGGLQRRWGAFASGLTAGPLVATLLEVLVGFMILLVAIVYISLNQRLSAGLDSLLNSLQSIENNPQALMPAVQRFASDPILAGFLLANFSLAVPMIEELAKPIAVWILMWKRALTPAQGFGLGAISGAGFAIAENLFSGAAVPGWAETTFVRIGATAFHIATAGLMGWALVRARNEKRYFLVLAVYVFNIVIHGLWNGVVVLGAFVNLPDQFSVFSGFTLAFITSLSIVILAYMNKRLRPAPLAPAKRSKRSSKIQPRR